MEFVLISDLHAHPWATFAKGEGYTNSRLQRSLIVLRSSLQEARERDCPWVFAGDLVHTAGYGLNIVLSGIARTLEDFRGVRKFVVHGNHDARGKGGRIMADETIFATLVQVDPRMVILRDGKAHDAGDFSIAGEGYQPRMDLLRLHDWEKADVGIFHQTIQGSRTPNDFELEGIPGELLTDLYSVPIVGHVHHPQWIHAGGEILIPGSPEHHNFGDRGEHGWWIIENGGASLVSGGSPKFLTVETPDEVKDDGNFYRVRTPPPTGSELPPGAIAISPDPTTVTQRDLLQGASRASEIVQVWLRENPPQGDPSKYAEIGEALLAEQDPVQLRPMRVESLHLRNFCSYQEADFKVEEGTFLVLGKGKDYPSNGAGKTTLVGEALYWLLFGRNTKGLAADEVIRWGAPSCEVSAVLWEPDDATLRVTRSRAASGGTELTVEILDYDLDGASPSPDLEDLKVVDRWEAASIHEMTQKLTRYLGVTPEIYQNLGYFSQEKLLLFASATDGERKDVLSDLIGLRAYQEAASVAGSKGNEASGDLETISAAIETLEEELEADQEAIQRQEERLREWEEGRDANLRRLEGALRDLREDPGPKALREEYEARERSLEIEKSRLEEEAEKSLPSRIDQILSDLSSGLEKQALAHRLDLQGAEETIAEQWESLEKAERMATALPGLQRGIQSQEKDVEWKKEALSKKDREIRSATASAFAQSRLVEKKRAELEEEAAIFAGGICPRCGQEITPEHREVCLSKGLEELQGLEKEYEEIKADADSLLAEMKVIEAGLRPAEAFLAKLQRKEQELVDIQDLLFKRDVAKGKLQEISEAMDDLREKAEEIARAETEKEISSHLEGRREELRRELAKIERMEWEREQKIQGLEDELSREKAKENPHEETLADVKIRKRRRKERLDRLGEKKDGTALQVAIFDYWRAGFGKRGIQSLLLEEIAAQFNTSRGDILPLLTQGVYDVQFSTLSRTQAGDLRERTEFQVFQHGNPIPYGSLSGGQRRRVDIGIMLTLVCAVSRWAGVEGILGILVLDEVFGFLDSAGSEGLEEALRQVREIIPTIYLVSQDPGLQALFPEVIEIVQDEMGVSRVES